MNSMFYEAFLFNSRLDSWDVTKVRDFSHMFYYADMFNKDLKMWDMSSAKSLQSMFTGARSFDQNLCSWASMIHDSANTDSMFENTDCVSILDPHPGSWCSACN